MRLLPTLLLLLVLPGLLLPVGLVLSLCRCASSRSPCQVSQSDDGAAARNDACCAATQCCPCGEAKADPGDGAGGTTMRAHQYCKCPVLRGPDHKTEATAPDRSGDPIEQPIAFAPEAQQREPLAPRVVFRGEAAELSRPPPDHARNLPLLL